MVPSWIDTQRSIVLAALPEDVGSVVPVLGDPMPSSDLLDTKHTHSAQVCMQTYKQPSVLTEHVINAMLKRNYLQRVDRT